MRPRQSSLGIIPCDYSIIRSIKGFNEAEAIKPRNPSIEASTARTCSSFNEAEAIKPRNQDGVEQPEAPGLASMRPRQSSLGISPPSNSFWGLSYFNVLRALGFIVPKVQETLLRNRHELLVSSYHTREKCGASTARDFRVAGALRITFGTSGYLIRS